MAKVFGIHHLHLKTPSKAAKFEQIVSEEFNALPQFPGWQFSIAKGERGENWEVVGIIRESRRAP